MKRLVADRLKPPKRPKPLTVRQYATYSQEQLARHSARQAEYRAAARAYSQGVIVVVGCLMLVACCVIGRIL